MNLDYFRDRSAYFVITLFVPEADIEEYRETIEELGRRRNVKLTVQPCPYEGIEFLYRICGDIEGHASSANTRDGDLHAFWVALKVKPGTPAAVIDKLAGHHYRYLLGILHQDSPAVSREAVEVSALNEHFLTAFNSPSQVKSAPKKKR